MYPHIPFYNYYYNPYECEFNFQNYLDQTCSRISVGRRVAAVERRGNKVNGFDLSSDGHPARTQGAHHRVPINQADLDARHRRDVRPYSDRLRPWPNLYQKFDVPGPICTRKIEGHY